VNKEPMNIIIDYEHVIRPGVFLGLLVVLAAVEFWRPLAQRKSSRARQWFINLTMVIIDAATLKLLVPLLAVGVAHYASEHSIGLLNYLDTHLVLAIIVSMLMLDLLIYGQHVLMHKLPVLWFLHRVHHTEIALDVSSAVRFHPVEIILSMLIKMLFVLIVGVPVVAVVIFEVLLNGLALFNHSNIKLAAGLDAFLRKLIVTPQVHWIHHSERVEETNSNYGFNLIIWDKLFSTYTKNPVLDYPDMQQGLREFGLSKPLNVFELLILPFKSHGYKKEAVEGREE
jgi:sterol desaturase/sphingolipid hydroxylase (fatty acid hydroxylase superfamily)